MSHSSGPGHGDDGYRAYEGSDPAPEPDPWQSVWQGRDSSARPGRQPDSPGSGQPGSHRAARHAFAGEMTDAERDGRRTRPAGNATLAGGRPASHGGPPRSGRPENGTPPNGTPPGGRPGLLPAWRRRRARKKQIRAARRTIIGRHPFTSAAIAVLLLLTPVWVSLGSALGDPGLGASPGARAAEWFRGHGGSSIVNWAENLWYSNHPPPVGGTPAKSSIPHLGTAGSHGGGTSAVAHLAIPRRLTSPAGHRLPGEGVWHPAGRLVDGLPAVYETWVRPDAVHTSLVIGVAWMDAKLLRATLYSGSTIPGGGPFRNTAPIPPAASRSLVAAFNAGFLMSNASGGYYTDHKTVIPLRRGAASFVIYRNGTANIADWGRDATMTPDVASVRQNLDLLVDHGKPVPGLNPNDTTQWGFTLGNSVYVWRSGVGITADGALVYVGGPGLNITTLADILARAGAVRAMELDINTDWVNFAAYAPPGAHGRATPANGRDLLPGMFGTPSRYFESWWSRDFFTMSARTAGPSPSPTP